VRAAIFTLICSVGISACDPAPPIAPDIGVHRFGDTFTTPAGIMQMVDEKVAVSFEEVSADSRCPKRVTCVWSGAATVKMLAMVEGEQPHPHRFQLTTTPESSRTEIYEGFRIELLDVEPYPDGTTKPAPDAYRITLRVTRSS
jgi:hypothetical protein